MSNASPENPVSSSPAALRGERRADALSLPDIAVTPAWLPAALVMILAAGMGILSGIYPAQRAASLDPITTLWHE